MVDMVRFTLSNPWIFSTIQAVMKQLIRVGKADKSLYTTAACSK